MRNAAGAIGTSRANGKGRLVLWAALIVGVLALARYLNAQALLQEALHWIQGLGPMGWVIFVLLYITATVLLLPAVVLTLGAGAIFGILKGWVIVSTVGSASFGPVAGSLVVASATPVYGVYVGPHTTHSYVITGSGLTQAKFVAIAAALVKVPKA